MTILVTAEIVARNLFGRGLPFSVEYTEYLVPVITFVGAAYTLREGGHVKVDVVLQRWPSKVRPWVVLIGYLLGLGFLIMVSIPTLRLALTAIRMHYLSLYPLQTPIGYVQLIVPIGLWLFALQVITEITTQARHLCSTTKAGAP